PYTAWLENIIELEPLIAPGPEPRSFDREALTRRQGAAGMSLEDPELILSPLAEEGKEAIGSMGDDTPLAVLSERYR
ncbi:glutamate synthase central domain-containing protein, partial [Gordonia paraffinivorans]|uniref:glutamate synthase central domain-containing protein n=1 Tax=Gordonia paraffinivorans TaxID=175628 RepID=UPI001446CD5F